MLKKIWHKTIHNHLLLMALCCLAPILAVFIVLPLFRGNGGNWVWAIILLCPLSHLLMMGGHRRGSACKPEEKKRTKHNKGTNVA